MQDYKETFVKYFAWQLKSTDVDPALSMLNYIFERQELNIEQRFWMAWLYGNTYQLPSAYVIWNEFPDYENVDQERLEKWNIANYKRLHYQVDNRWQKGHLANMFKSYREVVGGCQEDFFKELCQGSPGENYELVTKTVVNNFFKFGRYLTWFYTQTLKSCVGLNLEPTSLLLADKGSTSHRDGLCRVLGREDLLSRLYDENGKKIKTGVKPTKEDIDYLESGANEILQEMDRVYPDLKADRYLMETALCSFKKLFRVRDGRYLGYYLDRQAEEIRRLEAEGWEGVDWGLLWDYRSERLHPDLISPGKVNKEYMKEFPLKKRLINLEIYKEM